MARPTPAVHHLRRLLEGHHPDGAYHWQHVLAVLRAVTERRTAAHEAVLRAAAVSTRPLDIHPGQGLPHALPPEELVRRVAAQALAAWDRRAHRDVLRHVAANAEHDSVRRVAREALSG